MFAQHAHLKASKQQKQQQRKERKYRNIRWTNNNRTRSVEKAKSII